MHHETLITETLVRPAKITVITMHQKNHHATYPSFSAIELANIFQPPMIFSRSSMRDFEPTNLFGKKWCIRCIFSMTSLGVKELKLNTV